MALKLNLNQEMQLEKRLDITKKHYMLRKIGKLILPHGLILFGHILKKQLNLRKEIERVKELFNSRK